MLKTIIAVLILYVVWDKTGTPYHRYNKAEAIRFANMHEQVELLKKTTPGIVLMEGDLVALMVKGSWHRYVDAHAEALRYSYGDDKANAYQCHVLSFLTSDPHKFQSWGKKGAKAPCADNKNILY